MLRVAFVTCLLALFGGIVDGCSLAHERGRASDVGVGETDAGLDAVANDALGPPVPRRAVALAVGGWHACALDEAGDVYCWGASDIGQTGTGLHLTVATPTQVAIPPVVEIVAGEQHTCARQASGEVWCWGLGARGQLGPTPRNLPPCGSAQCAPEPIRATPFEPAARIFAGGLETCALRTDDTLVCLGDRGPLRGLPDRAPGLVGLATGRSVSCWQVGTELRCGGLDSGGARGDGTRDDGRVQLDGVAQLDVGADHACARTTDGSVWCWGSGFGGALARTDAELPAFCDGVFCAREPITLAEVSPARSISTSVTRTCTIGTDGLVRCWGSWQHDSLVICDETSAPICDLRPIVVPDLVDPVDVQVGGEVMCALTRGGGVRCLGMAMDGALGDGHVGGELQVTPSWVVGFPRE